MPANDYTAKLWWIEDGKMIVAGEDKWREPAEWNEDAKQWQQCSDCCGLFDEESAGLSHLNVTNGIKPRECLGELRPFTPIVLCDLPPAWGGPIVDEKGDRLYGSEEWITAAGANKYAPGTTIAHVYQRLFRTTDNTPNVLWLLRTKTPETIRENWPVTPEQCQAAADIVSFSYDDGQACMESQPDSIRPRGKRKNVFLCLHAITQDELNRGAENFLNCADLCRGLVWWLGPVEEMDLYMADDEPAVVDWAIFGLPELPQGFASLTTAEKKRPERYMDYLESISRQCKEARVPRHCDELGLAERPEGIKV